MLYLSTNIANGRRRGSWLDLGFGQRRPKAVPLQKVAILNYQVKLASVVVC